MSKLEEKKDNAIPMDQKDDDSRSKTFDITSKLVFIDTSRIESDALSAISAQTTSSTRSQQRKQRRKSRKGKSQHSLEYLRERISELMSIYEENGWFIPLPETFADQNDDSNKKKGKSWSNRNYGADKKRQRKQTERSMLENRIEQLEKVLVDEQGMDLNIMG